MTALVHLAKPFLSRDGDITYPWTGATVHWVYLKSPSSGSGITKTLWFPSCLTLGKEQTDNITFIPEIIVFFPWFLTMIKLLKKVCIQRRTALIMLSHIRPVHTIVIFSFVNKSSFCVYLSHASSLVSMSHIVRAWSLLGNTSHWNFKRWPNLAGLSFRWHCMQEHMSIQSILNFLPVF